MDIEPIHILTTGGTIDKIYFDDLSTYQIGEPEIGRILTSFGVNFTFNVVALMGAGSCTPAGDRTGIIASLSATSLAWMTVEDSPE